MSEALTVTHVRVRADRIEAEVRVASERYRLTDGPLAKRALLAVRSMLAETGRDRFSARCSTTPRRLIF